MCNIKCFKDLLFFKDISFLGTISARDKFSLAITLQSI